MQLRRGVERRPLPHHLGREIVISPQDEQRLVRVRGGVAVEFAGVVLGAHQITPATRRSGSLNCFFGARGAPACT